MYASFSHDFCWPAPRREILYLRIIMREFGFPRMYQVSRAVIAMAENPSNRKGARHMDTREHFVDHLVKDRIVKLVRCKPNKMVADDARCTDEEFASTCF